MSRVPSVVIRGKREVRACNSGHIHQPCSAWATPLAHDGPQPVVNYTHAPGGRAWTRAQTARLARAEQKGRLFSKVRDLTPAAGFDG